MRPGVLASRSLIPVLCAAGIFLVFSVLGCRSETPSTAPPAESALYAWVELGPGGAASARAITSGSCPSITVGSNTVSMSPRAASAPDSFEVTSCEHAIPAGAPSVSIGGQRLRLPGDRPRRIIVIGDTGCRIEADDVQNCTGKGSDPPWSFAEVAAAREPDLILHVGDYNYRKAACPEGNAGCAGSPHGDNWATWQAEFFEPVGELLAAAPWVFVRGNHEECGLAWQGWFYFLDPRPLGDDPWQEASCETYSQPYSLPIGDLALMVMDTSTILHDFDETPDADTVALYAGELDRLDALVEGAERAWLTTHRPFWALGAKTGDDGAVQLYPTDRTLQAALADSRDQALPAMVEWVGTGHVHNCEHLTFTDGRPAASVVGNGGTELGPVITPRLLDDNPEALQELALDRENFNAGYRFGYLLLEADGEAWSATMFSPAGDVELEFTVGG